jgi:hypothetical protein
MVRIVIAVLALVAAAHALAEPTGADVLAAFRKAGLEVQQPTKMRPKDYGFAPYVCKGTQFVIPSIGTSPSGFVFECPNDADRDALASHFRDMGRMSATAFTWVIVKGRIIVRINSDLDEEIVRKYEAALL